MGTTKLIWVPDMDNDTLDNLEFWKKVTEGPEEFRNFIVDTLDGRVWNEDCTNKADIDKREREAILKGFQPDKYYSAFEKMMAAERSGLITDQGAS